MTHKDPFSRFIDLVTLDRGIYDLNTQVKAMHDEIALLQAQENSVASALAHCKDKAHGAKKKVMAIELEIKELDAAELKKKGQFERTSGQKEYFALQAELEQLNTKRLELEDNLITTWNALDAVEREAQKQQVLADEQMLQVATALHAKNKEKQALMQRIDEQMSTRAAIEQAVPEEWLSKYTTMRASVADPVVAEQDGMCPVCYYPLTGQDLISLNRHKLVQCKGCFRLLYLASRES
jgi:predicted  nucleic acid-binding Zn-ribbon protein